MMGSVSRVAPWVVVRVTLASPRLPWMGETGVCWQGLGPGLGSHDQDQGLGSGFRMWHLGPGPGAGNKVRVRVQGLRSGVKGWGSVSESEIKI